MADSGRKVQGFGKTLKGLEYSFSSKARQEKGRFFDRMSLALAPGTGHANFVKEKWLGTQPTIKTNY